MKELELQLEKLQEKHLLELQKISNEQKDLKGEELRISWAKEDELKEKQLKQSWELLQLLHKCK